MVRENEIFVVIVTYGKRFNYFERVVKETIKQGCENIVLVQNGIEEETCNKIKKLKDECRGLIHILNEQNLGSAGGVVSGLKYCIKHKECKYIWFLDDDNCPEAGALEELLDALKIYGYNPKIALNSIRYKRDPYKSIAKLGDVANHFPSRNSFLGFHMNEIIGKIGKHIFKIKTEEKKGKGSRFVEIPFSPYGGLFIAKKSIELIGLPNEDFYLYGDDNEFTYRFNQIRGKVVLCCNSLIDDIDISWDANDPYTTSFSKFFEGEAFRVYYGVRNRVYFEWNSLVKSRVVYIVNMLLYSFIVCTIGLIKFNLRSIKIYIAATIDGLFNKLGIKSI